MPASFQEDLALVRSSQDPNWLPKLVAALKGVPAHLQECGYELLGVDAAGEEVPEHKARPAFARAKAMADLKAADRLELLETLFPGKGRALEAGWQLLREYPYRQGQPWRSPASEAPGLVRRLDWLGNVSGLLATFGNRPLAWFADRDTLVLRMHNAGLGVLLAAAMDLGGAEADELASIVLERVSARGPSGHLNRELIEACLGSRRPELVRALEKLLLEAGREEGVREMILQRVDSSRAEVFTRFVRLVLEHGLVRFSSVVQAFNGWFRFPYDAASGGQVESTLRTVLRFLEDAEARAAGWRDPDAQMVHLALWAEAFLDIGKIELSRLEALLTHPHASHRLVTARFAASLDRAVVHQRLTPLLADDDWRVAGVAAMAFQDKVPESVRSQGLVDALGRLLDRLPKTLPEFKPLVWPWEQYRFGADEVMNALLANRGEQSPVIGARHLPKLSSEGRERFAFALVESKDFANPMTRQTLLELAGDPAPGVRAQAVRGLKACSPLAAEELTAVVALLRRKNSDLRRQMLELLLAQPDAVVLEASDRLTASRDAGQRTAGIELLRQLGTARRATGEIRRRAERLAAGPAKLTAADRIHLDTLLTLEAPALTMDDALGLAPADRLTPPLEPQMRSGPFSSPTSERLATSLETLFQSRNTKTFRRRDWLDGEEFDADLAVAFNYCDIPDDPAEVAAADARIPLRPVWVEWLKTRGEEQRDPDGFELLRLLARKFARWKGTFVESAMEEAERRRLDPFLGPGWAKTDPQRRWGEVCFQWLLRLDPPGGDWPGFVLDGVESTIALIREQPWDRAGSCSEGWLHVARLGRHLVPEAWRPEHHARLWRLLRWRDEAARKGLARVVGSAASGREEAVVRDALLRAKCSLERWRGSFEDAVAAFTTGGATEADVCDVFLSSWQSVEALTARRPHHLLRDHPPLRPLVERCLTRLLEVELARGDTPTVATDACRHIASMTGSARFLDVLAALEGRSFDRQRNDDQSDRDSVLSGLLRRCFPGPEDTPERFAVLAKARGFRPERLVEAAAYAPQWAPHVEAATGWAGLAEGIAWVHAHTKVAEWEADDEEKQAWRAEMALHSPLTSEDLMDGAVDVAWFHRIHERLGPKRWAVLGEAAKYASAGAGHARARLFADALRGEASEKDLTQRIQKQRQQDAMRALGLLPLPARGREAVLLRRYEALQEFVRGSREFGAQRRASEKRAFEIGLANLARTSGYSDPIRLQWAMESRAVADLAEAAITAKVKDVTMKLSMDVWGEVDTTVTQAGKPLKDLPSALKKRPEFAALRDRKAELKRQAARIRTSLETLMVRGDPILGGELPELMRHPLLAPMLRGLVLVGDGIAGYPVKEGRVLERYDGRLEPVKVNEALRIAHPLDLLPARDWAAWQRECFARERVQPFKQVFRELYPLTDTERGEATQTRRYAGHQVWPRQALALLGTRGWVHHPEEGVRKVMHEAGLIAWIEFQEAWWTPAEIEGLTFEAVYFTRRGGHDRLRLEEVPARWFSEAMRDLDLVVSVAHRGGVDPEASASTIESRAALVRETAALLKLDNVAVKERVAVIQGRLGGYTVHLGSAVTHRLPGGMLFIVPVHSQHRGRLFLPFADPDPKTAEVLSKVLLLARDHEIKDPSILDQIRR